MKRYAGKHVLIFGFGLHGGALGAAKFFLRAGAEVCITDKKDEGAFTVPLAQLPASPKLRLAFGGHRNGDIKWADIVVKNPGVPASSPYIILARRLHKEITSELGVFLDHAGKNIVAVTGTKGKSTTTTLLYQLIKSHKPRAILGGNIRVSMLDALVKMKPADPAVLELSSFHLEILSERKKSPHIAVITNLFADHLDRYKSLGQYYDAKWNIVRFQKRGDYAILNADNKEIVRRAQSLTKQKILWFSQQPIDNGVFIHNGDVYFSKNRKLTQLFPLSDIQIPGEHNQMNVLAATAAALAYGVPVAKIRRVVASFTGVAGRMESLGTVQGRTWINDTTATVPDATIAALRSFTKPVILLGGGHDKNLPFDALVNLMPEKVAFCILFRGSGSDRLIKLMKQKKKTVPHVVVDSMAEAGKQALKHSTKGDTILLSPAAASFGVFVNEFDRGDQFMAFVKGLKKR